MIPFLPFTPQPMSETTNIANADRSARPWLQYGTPMPGWSAATRDNFTAHAVVC
jgi:hypothetical protein